MKVNPVKFPALIAMFCAATPALADVTVTFIEGAPTDRFVIAATDDCLTTPSRITIDLSGSDAGLVFDVTAQGAGVEVFQPFKLVSGAQYVAQASPLTDGATRITLDMRAMPAGAQVAFTTDLDDTIGQREITVSGAEIAGATMAVTKGFETGVAAFGRDAVARLASCPR